MPLPATNEGSVPLPLAISHQLTWNPTYHSHRPSTADASFQPITETFSKQLFLKLIPESILRITSSLLTILLADTTRQPRSSQPECSKTCSTASSSTKQQFLFHQAADPSITKQQALASPSRSHLDHREDTGIFRCSRSDHTRVS